MNAPTDSDRWNCTCEQPEGHLVCPSHHKWPNRYTDNAPPARRSETLEERVTRLEERTYPRKLTPEQLAAYRRILDEQAD